MKESIQIILDSVRERDPHQIEFHQAVESFLTTIDSIIGSFPDVIHQKVLERMVEPERALLFRVPWKDDKGILQVNRGFRVQMNSALGPYKGGLRFHPSVKLDTIKFLAFEQVFKNALTGLPMGGGKGGGDFDPKGKSDTEVMSFCQSFMSELQRHIGPNTDVPAGDIGVGKREIGYLYGQYKRLKNEFTGALTGKSPVWGGSYIRPEATGYGLVYIAGAALESEGISLEGKTALISGSGNVAQFTAEKLIHLGAKPLSFSDTSGCIYDPEGINAEKLEFVKYLKNVLRGRISEYVVKYPSSFFLPREKEASFNPLWDFKTDLAFPCATQNEIEESDAAHLADNGVILIAEGANMPTTAAGTTILQSRDIIYLPSKAANAGGVAVSGLEMAQNSTRLQWTPQKVDKELLKIMRNIFSTISETAEQYGMRGNYTDGANIASFLRVSSAMIDQGYV